MKPSGGAKPKDTLASFGGVLDQRANELASSAQKQAQTASQLRASINKYLENNGPLGQKSAALEPHPSTRLEANTAWVGE